VYRGLVDGTRAADLILYEPSQVSAHRAALSLEPRAASEQIFPRAVFTR